MSGHRTERCPLDIDVPVIEPLAVAPNFSIMRRRRQPPLEYGKEEEDKGPKAAPPRTAPHYGPPPQIPRPHDGPAKRQKPNSPLSHGEAACQATRMLAQHHHARHP